MILWNKLADEVQLQQLIDDSGKRAQLIFKYSSRCSLSDVVKHRLEKDQEKPSIEFYFLDVITCRSLSDKIADLFDVYHESPQVLLIKNGACIYDESHLGIRMKDIIEQAFVAI